MKALLWSALMLTGLAGCGDAGQDELKQWMETSARDLKGGVLPLPELQALPVVSYDASETIDPFSAVRIEPERKAGGGANRPDLDRPREQLESFPLESISFVGLVHKGKINHALVQVDGVVYSVRTGNYMGQNFGRITGITNSEITIKEVVQDPSGQTADWVERQMTLQLQEGSPGKESKK